MRRLTHNLDPDSFLHLFLPGLEACMKRFEDGRDGHATKNDADLLVGNKIGPLVPLARPGEDGDMSDRREYIKRVLAFDLKAYTNPETYLERNMYILWQVPESVYVSSLQEEMDSLSGLFYRSIPPGGEGQPEDTPCQLSELVAKLRDLILNINDAVWSKSHIDEQINPFIKSVFSDSKTSSYQNWGYHLLRWVLAGLQPGPSVSPTMEILGKEETMRRFQQAVDIAERWEKSRTYRCRSKGVMDQVT